MYISFFLVVKKLIKEITANGRIAVPNTSKVIEQNRRSAKVSEISNEANDEMHYRHIYRQQMNAANDDEQMQRAKLEQVRNAS